MVTGTSTTNYRSGRGQSTYTFLTLNLMTIFLTFIQMSLVTDTKIMQENSQTIISVIFLCLQMFIKCSCYKREAVPYVEQMRTDY